MSATEGRVSGPSGRHSSKTFPKFVNQTIDSDVEGLGMDFAGQMRAMYDEYIETFNRADSSALIGYFAYPWALDGPHGSMVIEDAEKHLQILAKVRTTFVNTGWTHSRNDKIDVYALAGDTCMLVAHITRYRIDNSIVNRSCAYYTFRHLDGRWRIVATVEVPLAS